MKKVYGYIVTYPNGELCVISGAVFSDLQKAEDELFNAFYDDYYIKPSVDMRDRDRAEFKIYKDAYSANRNQNHIFNAQIISFVVL